VSSVFIFSSSTTRFSKSNLLSSYYRARRLGGLNEPLRGGKSNPFEGTSHFVFSTSSSDSDFLISRITFYLPLPQHFFFIPPHPARSHAHATIGGVRVPAFIVDLTPEQRYLRTKETPNSNRYTNTESALEVFEREAEAAAVAVSGRCYHGMMHGEWWRIN
jgi:hypothetical protein